MRSSRTYYGQMLTSQEIRGFNQKAPQYTQIEEVRVTWPEEREPVTLTLTLRPDEPSLQHTRLVLRAKGVQGLRLFPDRITSPQIGRLEIREISDRGWDKLLYEIADAEQDESIAFYCSELEGEFRYY